MATDVDFCRLKNIGVGDLFDVAHCDRAGRETALVRRYRITAIGEESILARIVWEDGTVGREERLARMHQSHIMKKVEPMNAPRPLGEAHHGE